jgi:hypothetical protein
MLQRKFKYQAAEFPLRRLFGGAVMEATITPVHSKTTEMKIGKTVYIVTTHYNPSGRETAEEKMFRIVTSRINEAVKTPEKTD